ncbi:MAG: hypothetical protein EOO78_11850, partial [Oxalobacteraceae bacterium]
MVDVDEGEVIQLLQHEVAGVVQDAGARVVADRFQEALEADAVVQVLARMQFVAQVDAGIFKRVQDRPQRPAGLVEEAFGELARRWRPILDAFEDAGVDLCYELHPGEDLHDGVS